MTGTAAGIMFLHHCGTVAIHTVHSLIHLTLLGSFYFIILLPKNTLFIFLYINVKDKLK